ncbi:hypothetical protein [Bombilactobacillus thymidiniphilus]|uniref:Uncharacterized protein n=1 Tax=Bombilactobacillus thymidiniphilus TaxID=2923363 RepID=A0ABY4PF16_9LACO|nr:hypothetical protein [Bombilactobacillus thymidiniphilus]UQS84263.1 hypothetical protein MOO47_03690 [Bombilactobacillus thymidiniphilus]
MSSKTSINLDNGGKYTDKQRQNLANDEYNHYSIGEPVKAGKGSNVSGFFVDKFNNSVTGSQVYADWGENDISAGAEVLLHAGVATPQFCVYII